MADPSTYDEAFVAILKAVTVNELDNRVFHLEVYQKNSKFESFPCLLYSMKSCTPNGGPEASGMPGNYISDYLITIISKESDDIKTVSKKLFRVGSEAPNDANYELYSPVGFDWLDIVDEGEAVEYAIELEAKGYKTSSLCGILYHRELENHASSQ